MKKVFFENLPTWAEGSYKGKINWTEAVGHSIKFIYDDIQGEMKLIKYNKDRRKILVKYEEVEKEIGTSQLLKCEIAVILGILIKEYRYNISTVVKTLTGSIKILEQKRKKITGVNVKAYKFECINDGYTNDITEDVLVRGVGCPVCSNKVIIKGINDIATTAPEYVKYFIDINDAYKCCKGAKIKVKLKCLECGQHKTMSPFNLTAYGFTCSKCGDGVPYPEKFIVNLLEQLNIKFEVQKMFKWSNGVIYDNEKLNGSKKYDFYIPSLNLIIESHGRQHYDIPFNKNGRTIEEEQENDKLKEQLAKENGIKYYIVFDCRFSDLEWIKKSVIESKINSIFNLNVINWDKCNLTASSSKLRKACRLWNEGFKIAEISEMLKVSSSTIHVYLRKGKDLNLCEYVNTKAHKKIIVYDLNQKELGRFDSRNQLARESESIFGVKFSTCCISNVCNELSKSHKGFKFTYV